MVFAVEEVAMLCILIFLSFLASIESSLEYVGKLSLPLGVMGPEATVFDSSLERPYTGVADGRILKYQGNNVGFQDYAVDSPNRSSGVCDLYNGNFDSVRGPICGRPVGLGFSRTGELYIADAYRGLLKASTNGGVARQLATSVDGIPFRLPDGLGIDNTTGTVYFTDASAVYSLSEIALAIAANDSSGRLLKYDPQTGAVTTLVSNLSGPAGVSVSLDGNYLLFTEFIAGRIQKYWLSGPKANTMELVLNVPGRPDNIKRTAELGVYWVAVNQQTLLNPINVPSAYQITSSGTVLQNISLSAQYGITLISEVHQIGSTVYVGSLYADSIGLYRVI